MAYPKRQLEIIPECNDENENPRCWSMLVCETGDKKHYIWITKYSEKEYIIEDSNGYNRTNNKVFKTLWGAKRQAEEIAWRQEETGYFSD